MLTDYLPAHCGKHLDVLLALVTRVLWAFVSGDAGWWYSSVWHQAMLAS